MLLRDAAVSLKNETETNRAVESITVTVLTGILKQPYRHAEISMI